MVFLCVPQRYTKRSAVGIFESSTKKGREYMDDMQVYCEFSKYNEGELSVRGLPSHWLWGQRENLALNDEYEEYANSWLRVTLDGWRIHFHWRTQSTMEMVSDYLKNYNRYLLCSLIFKHWRTKRTSRGYYHSFRLWWYVWRHATTLKKRVL